MHAATAPWLIGDESRNMTLCSVVIPWHRGLADLSRAVGSVLSQDHAEFEIIVMANGVSDGDFAAAAALSGDGRYRVVRLPVAGASSARNEGARLAAGDLVFFLDADDRFHPQRLARFVALAGTDPFDIAFSRGLRLRPGGVSWPWPVEAWDGRSPLAEFFYCGGGLISTSAIVIAGAVKDRLRFSEQFTTFEDPDLIIRAEAMGLRIRMLPEPLYDYFDDRGDNRLSKTPDWDERLAFIDAAGPNVSRKARAAFRVRCVAQHLFPRRPLLCARLFADALVTRAVPPRDLVLFAVRGLIPPRLRHALLDRYFARRAATSDAPAASRGKALGEP
jgi:glycosyltransferase involved in cell wall biosynthesis